MLKKIKNQRGFALIEFVIALPLFVLLIYALAQMIMQISSLSHEQAADYVLENEAHEILEQIKKDARAAASVQYRKLTDKEALIFVFHTTTNYSGRNIVDIRDTRRYIRYAKKYEATSSGLKPIYHIYAQRQNAITAPITGENSLSDTSVEEFEVSIREKNILHISLSIKSMETERIFKVNTSVFMPALEENEGFSNE